MMPQSRIGTSKTLLKTTLLFGLASLAFGCNDAEWRYDNGYYGYPDYMYENGGEYRDQSGSEDVHVEFPENEFIDTSEENRSTFSVDVNTASYTLMRRDLNRGVLPNPASVRAEEFINFFRFEYPSPAEDPFSINMEVAPSYFGSDDDINRHLLRIGLRGKDVALEDMKPNNLVFLIDVSGSMGPENRLPLAKQSLHILLDNLRPTDTVAIQTYANGTERVLSPTPVSERQTITAAINGLVASGGTFGEGGIVQAYNMAEEAFVDGGNNRVIILTDGDFNIGARGEDLYGIIESYRDRNITLTAAGFGLGRYHDATMERIAREGSGNYYYIDTLAEAERIFGTHLPSTLEVIASDVRIQVIFDEDVVRRYRLVGYEKRVLENEDFEDESTNAAEVGPGHTVTAFYELELHEEPSLDSPFLAEVRIRYKEELGAPESLEIQNYIKLNQILDTFEEASPGFRFAAAVAYFASVLRHSQFAPATRFDEIIAIGDAAKYADYPEQAEFLELVSLAEDLWVD